MGYCSTVSFDPLKHFGAPSLGGAAGAQVHQCTQEIGHTSSCIGHHARSAGSHVTCVTEWLVIAGQRAEPRVIGSDVEYNPEASERLRDRPSGRAGKYSQRIAGAHKHRSA